MNDDDDDERCWDLCLFSCSVLHNRLSVETHSFLIPRPDFRPWTTDYPTDSTYNTQTLQRRSCEPTNGHVFRLRWTHHLQPFAPSLLQQVCVISSSHLLLHTATPRYPAATPPREIKPCMFIHFHYHSLSVSPAPAVEATGRLELSITSSLSHKVLKSHPSHGHWA